MQPYSDGVADHFNSPRNAGAMDNPDAVGRASLAGRAPYVTIFVKVRDGIVAHATFQTFGCGFSIACCSALTEMAAGRTVEECLTLSGRQLKDLLSLPPHKAFCAALAVEALRDALVNWPHSKDSGESG